MTQFREAVVDLDAIAANIRHLAQVVGGPDGGPLVLAVVKANAYGHGAVPVARTALAAGARWLGVADIQEGLELRRAAIVAPILAWLHGPDADFAAAIAAEIDLGLSSLAQLDRAADAAALLGRSAAVQLKLETGLSRNGAAPDEWAELFARAAVLEREGRVHVRGIMSHLSNTSPADDAESIACFDRGIASARAAGLAPELIHLAATAGALRVPESRYSMVRLGIAIYGLSPFDDADSKDLGLIPAMSVRGQIAAVRRVAAGAGVSYDYTWRAQVDSTLALVPLGYADGIPRQSSGRAEVQMGTSRYPVVGRIAMDQFVVNLGQDTAEVGDEVVLFGDPASGVPSATDWADAALSVNYEIVTRIGHRVTRSYRGGPSTEVDAQQ
ncbi:alanine racemase [Leifsonia kafniensis]|uniref:Alanine racemase n=1 Tax=Leifsonia kafniensis TaxID=475957 RepID=A0ABP7KPD9_9MICO